MSNAPSASTSYLQDILDQPRALRNTVAGLVKAPSVRPFAEGLASGALRRVVLTGMGASFHALYPLHLTLIARGVPAQRLETSELIHYAPTLLEPQTLVVAVSQSGRSAETLQLLERVRGRAPIIGVTNGGDSPLAAQADVGWVTRAGPETSVSCKTYQTALAVLAVLGEALTGRDPHPTLAELEGAPEAVARYLADWKAYVGNLQQRLAGIHHLILAGRGPSLAAAGTGGLIIKEAARFPAEGMSGAAFRHGPLEMVSPRLFVLVYRGAGPTAELNARLAADIRAAGGQAALVVEAPEPDVFTLPPGPASGRPLLEILPAQMISLALAGLQGHEAGRFERATKVTTTE